MFRWHVVSAVFWRNVKQYFSGVLGYLFIVVFVTVCAMMAFGQQFFADNLANLDQLSRWFPILLLFFIPAVTMGVWADEKKQGTDAILFTLPATDFEILLGKYLSVAAVYTVALLFSTTQLIALSLIGNPDWGVIAATYLGYWLSGLSLLAVGMFASSLTNSPTVAFVLGAIFCAIPVLIGYYFRGFVEFEKLGIDWNLRDFTIGLVPLTNIVYFVTLTGFMLYLNLIVVSRRHWSRGQHVTLAGHFLVRIISLAVGLIALNYLIGVGGSYLMTRLDLTSEKLYSLDQTTLDTIQAAKDNERTVSIQAFVSKDVPRKYVNAQKQFTGLLRQYDLYGGNYVDVRFVDVGPNSSEAQEAQRLGIEPKDDRSEIGGRTVEQQVFMGALVSSSLGDVALPFVDGESSIEYELSRSISTTTDKKRQLTIGILDTDAHFGGPEIEGRRINWAYNNTLEQLKKQFKLKFISQTELADYVVPSPDPANPDQQPAAAKEPPNVLLVPDPSSLATPAMDALIKYLGAGNPAVILADPLPFFWTFQNPTGIGVLNAPRQNRISPRSPYAQLLTSSPLPKDSAGTADKLLKLLGIEWDNGQTAWNLFNPHPSFEPSYPDYLGDRWPEYYGPYERAFVWVRPHAGIETFNKDEVISSGLKELLFFYPGTLKKAPESNLKFEPLVTLGRESGVSQWDEFTMVPTQKVRRLDPRTGRATMEERAASSQITQEDLIVIRPTPESYLDDDEHVLAARITGDKLNVVFISDLDFLSDLYYSEQQPLEQQLDNLSLLQNSIEVLAGDTGFVSLRNRRPTPRTLTKVETRLEEFRAERAKQQEIAEKRVRDQLEEAQLKLDEATKEIEGNQSLSFFEKLQQTSQKASDTQRQFDIKKAKLDKELKIEIEELKSAEQQQVSRLENWIRYLSVGLAPLPALLLGIAVLFIRTANERKHISPDRRV
jgi:ABC-2 type transport system permease protein